MAISLEDSNEKYSGPGRMEGTDREGKIGKGTTSVVPQSQPD
jgi:hypothetical protein